MAVDATDLCDLQKPAVRSGTSLFTQEAGQIIRERGLRTTRDRVFVLAGLLMQSGPVSHSELFAQFAAEGVQMDRVTLYRILNWLTKNGVACRFSGWDRIWRFGYNEKRGSSMHACFHCEQCGHCSFLREVPVPDDICLPEGFSQSNIDLTVTGICQKCVLS